MSLPGLAGRSPFLRESVFFRLFRRLGRIEDGWSMPCYKTNVL